MSMSLIHCISGLLAAADRAAIADDTHARDPILDRIREAQHPDLVGVDLAVLTEVVSDTVQEEDAVEMFEVGGTTTTLIGTREIFAETTGLIVTDQEAEETIEEEEVVEDSIIATTTDEAIPEVQIDRLPKCLQKERTVGPMTWIKMTTRIC
jgi:hypothetical protein